MIGCLKMSKVISFSLWGNNPIYTQGAIRNAILAMTLFPGWTCRFYIGQSTDFKVTEDLIGLTDKWTRFVRVENSWQPMCGKGHGDTTNIEIYHVPEEGDWRGMFWRFEPASDPNVEAMISRDCDSRLSNREVAAVNAWMESDKGFHIMRDHPWHGSSILGGMWGVKANVVPNMIVLMTAWDQEDRWQTDQDFLNSVIYPRITDNCMVHASFCRMEPHARDFPVPRIGTEFIGQVFGEHGQTVAEHVKALAQAL